MRSGTVACDLGDFTFETVVRDEPLPCLTHDYCLPSCDARPPTYLTCDQGETTAFFHGPSLAADPAGVMARYAVLVRGLVEQWAQERITFRLTA